MNELKTERWNGYEIRFVWKDNDWWAVAKDVADALGYANARDAVRLHVDKQDKIPS